MTTINNDTLNNSNSDYNIFLLIKSNLKNGTLQINDLSSKNRALLHRVCAQYGLEHYSTGSYSNRTFVIKDNSHTYFSESINKTITTDLNNTTTTDPYENYDTYWKYYTSQLNNSIVAPQVNTTNTNMEVVKEEEVIADEEEEENEEEVMADEEEEENEEDVDEEVETDSNYSDETHSTDTYSSTTCSTNSVDNSDVFENKVMNKLENNIALNKYIYLLTATNLFVNLFILIHMK
tara:strand:- start:4878 stop:5582 length:705 start_codon:yes stop_codon:yes gene_type:complete